MKNAIESKLCLGKSGQQPNDDIKQRSLYLFCFLTFYVSLKNILNKNEFFLLTVKNAKIEI
jgi:hypothetical protein